MFRLQTAQDNPEFMAMEADIKQRHKKQSEKAITAEKCRQRGNQCMKEGDFVGAIEHYDEGLGQKNNNNNQQPTTSNQQPPTNNQQ